MDASLINRPAFWHDLAPLAAGTFGAAMPACPELSGQVLFATSGSSGTPKWLALSKIALLASAAAVNRHLDVTPESCWGLALPLHHVGGFGVAARAFAAGCGLREYPGRWDAHAFSRWLQQSQVTHTSLVPTQVHDLVAAGRQAPASLRAIVVGGGHLDAAAGQAARALGWPVLASYGMTEACSQIATQGLGALEAIYQPAPLPLLEIWQAETTEDQQLRIAGPALFSGWLVPSGTTWIYHPRTTDPYLTNDRVLLENRALTPLGRTDSRIKVMGELIDPGAIELELATLAAGRLAPGTFAVVAIPDARTEHSLVPVFDAAVDAQLIAAVLTAYACQAPGFRRLRPAVILDKFPCSALGKPLRAEIVTAVLGG